MAAGFLFNTEFIKPKQSKIMAKKNAPENVDSATQQEQQEIDNGAHSFTEASNAHEVNKTETAPPAPRTATRPKGKYLVSGGDFHEFTSDNPVFVGAYTGRKMVREKDGKEENQKAGDTMGYYFADPDGVETVIGNSHSIDKAVSQIKAGDVLYIEFLGQKQVGTRKFNQFDIILLDSVEEKAQYGF